MSGSASTILAARSLGSSTESTTEAVTGTWGVESWHRDWISHPESVISKGVVLTFVLSADSNNLRRSSEDTMQERTWSDPLSTSLNLPSTVSMVCRPFRQYTSGLGLPETLIVSVATSPEGTITGVSTT